MSVYAEHLLAGLVFAATGYGTRKLCHHRGWEAAVHKVGLTVLLVLAETVVVVRAVG